MEQCKAKFCRRHGIDIHIDDSDVYGLSFTTPYCLYDSVSRTCCLSKNNTVSFALPPRDCLHRIEKALAAL